MHCNFFSLILATYKIFHSILPDASHSDIQFRILSQRNVKRYAESDNQPGETQSDYHSPFTH